jgi:hypothetical protein
MSWHEDLVAAIHADGVLRGIIAERIFADVAPGEAEAPLIVYQQVSETGETTFDGRRDVTFPLVQFSCWAATKLGAVDLAAALSRCIEGRNLPGLSGTSLGFSNGESTRDQQTKLFCERLDYTVSCKRI